jgi:hypothetical protein
MYERGFFPFRSGEANTFQRATNFHAATATKMAIPTKYAQPRPFWSSS